MDARFQMLHRGGWHANRAGRLRAPWAAGAALVMVAGLAGCGGGGGDDAPAPWSGLTIEVPADADTFQTDQPQLALRGRAFVPEGSTCDSGIGKIAPGYRIRWRNAASGDGGDAHLQLNCLLQVSLTWDLASVPLVSGANVVTVTATSADGQTGVDSIAITRKP